MNGGGWASEWLSFALRARWSAWSHWG